MKKFLSSAAAALLIAGTVAFGSASANATQTDECVPAEAWSETVVVTPEVPAVPEVPEVSHTEYQRYSWTGGPTETAPAEVPPSANWQANTTDYAGAGKGSDPVGESFKGNGNSDWFFWTGTKVIDTPYQAGKPAVPAVTTIVEHPAVTCEEEPVSVTPQACVGAGDWYTEGDDLAPVATPEGLVFAGGSGKAVGYRTPVTGNLQGWAPVSFDATGGTEQFFFRVVIDASADGGPAYKSLSFPGYTTIDSSSVSYQYGETLAQTALRFPNNKVTSVGFQTNSGAPADYSATLKSVTGPCATVDFTYTEEEPPVILPSCTTVTGSQVLVGDGKISVPGDWASESIAVPFSGSLKDIGTVLEIQADPLPFVGLHIHTAQGTIVFEEEASYNGQLWSQSTWDGVEAGLGYPALGTIEKFIERNGDVVVTGIDLLYTHPEASTTTVTSFTIGCTTFTFKPAVTEEPPVVTPPTEEPPVVTPPVITPEPTPTATAAAVDAEELASTGSDTNFGLALWIVAGTIGAGIIFLIAGFLCRRSHPVE